VAPSITTSGKYLTLGAGWNAYPGTLSLQGSHPYWQSYDRVMADEFFRPFFSQGVFAQGDLLPRLQYRLCSEITTATWT
jgi:hypothetical protein